LRGLEIASLFQFPDDTAVVHYKIAQNIAIDLSYEVKGRDLHLESPWRKIALYPVLQINVNKIDNA
jgi:hypothetical protein